MPPPFIYAGRRRLRAAIAKAIATIISAPRASVVNAGVLVSRQPHAPRPGASCSPLFGRGWLPETSKPVGLTPCEEPLLTAGAVPGAPPVSEAHAGDEAVTTSKNAVVAFMVTWW
jgi:hypothetical protein